MVNKKHKLSISVDEETIVRIREALRTGNFRNRSHVFEHAVRKMLDEVEYDA